MSTAVLGSLRFNAERYLRHAGRWVSCSELATHLGVETGDVASSLLASRRQRITEGREHGYGTLEFRFISKLPQPQAWPQFQLDPPWPPGFVSRFLSVSIPRLEARAK
jgi:hypothetical protein